MGGDRDNTGKLPVSLVPVEAIEGIAEVLAFGREKYDAHNWRKGLSWTETYDSLQRHAMAWLSGEENDPESGLSHLHHMGCNISFLITFAKRGLGEDDRFKPSPDLPS